MPFSWVGEGEIERDVRIARMVSFVAGISIGTRAKQEPTYYKRGQNSTRRDRWAQDHIGRRYKLFGFASSEKYREPL